MKERFPDFCNVFSGKGGYRGVKSVSLRAVDNSLDFGFLDFRRDWCNNCSVVGSNDRGVVLARTGGFGILMQSQISIDHDKIIIFVCRR